MLCDQTSGNFWFAVIRKRMRCWNHEPCGQDCPKRPGVANRVSPATSSYTMIMKTGIVLKPKGIRFRLNTRNRWTR